MMTRFMVILILAAAALRTALGVEIASSTLKAVFGEGAAKGRLVSLVDKRGCDYVSARNVDVPAWSVTACRTNDFTQRKTVSAFEAQTFVARRDGDVLTLEWTDAGPCVAKFVATVTAKPGDPALRCRTSVTPKPGWGLVETQFPCCALNECLGSTPTDDAIVMGTGHGGLVRFPMNPRREYWKCRHMGRSPGNLVAQFGSFFDDRGGLYTSAEDADGNEKELLMDRWWRETRPDGSYTGGAFLLRWSRCEYAETTDTQPYDILLRGFENPDGEATTWYDAADIYKQWAEQQFWCRRKFLEKDDLLPAWAREAPVVMCFNRRWFDRPEFLKKWLNEWWAKKFPGRPLLAILEGWEQHGDWIAAEYFPCYPDDAKFMEMTGWMKAVGAHPWPWPGGHHWNVTVGEQDDGTYRLDFSQDFWNRAAAHAVKGPDGNVHLYKLGWLEGGRTASMCPGDPWTVDWWNKDISCALVKRGADLVQADQDVGARIPVCWSRDHGHKPGPGRWRMLAQRHQFETMLQEMRKINPDALFSFEEMHEYFTDIYVFADYRNCRWPGPEWASVYNYLYHEYTQQFQSGAEQYGKPYWLAFCAADGQMPRLPVDPRWYEDVEGVEIFPNGSFERLAQSGKGFADWEKPETHGVVTNDVKEGKYALRVKATGRRTQVARSILADFFWQKDATYRVTAWLKGETDNKANSFSVSALRREAGKYKHFGGVSFAVPKASEGWKHVSSTFTIQPGAEFVRFMLDAYDNTSFLVDGVTFEERQPDGTFAPVIVRAGSAQTETLAFIERWIRLYAGEGRKWLAHGRMLHPPKVECDNIAYDDVFRGTTHDNVKPAVFGTAWEAADGTRAVMLVNATPYDQKIAWHWKGRSARMTLKPRELSLIPQER